MAIDLKVHDTYNALRNYNSGDKNYRVGSQSKFDSGTSLIFPYVFIIMMSSSLISPFLFILPSHHLDSQKTSTSISHTLERSSNEQ